MRSVREGTVETGRHAVWAATKPLPKAQERRAGSPSFQRSGQSPGGGFPTIMPTGDPPDQMLWGDDGR